MSDTPRTDDKCIELDGADGKVWHVVPVEFAQMIERELAAANERIAGLQRERDALQAWKTTHRWHCACVFDGDDEGPTQECNYHAGLREDASHIRADLADVNAECDALRQQLPPEMQDCTIRFVECPKGHGQLTATNGVQHECVICERDALRKKYDDALLRLANQDDECITLIAERDALRRGEFICRKCGLRKDADFARGDF